MKHFLKLLVITLGLVSSGLMPLYTLADELKLENLMKTELEGVSAWEVVVSRVDIPPDTALPRHWHPGEEFAYVLSGSVTLWQKDQVDRHFKQGELAKVPLKQIHTAIAGPQGVKLLIFRVHETGQPERIDVD